MIWKRIDARKEYVIEFYQKQKEKGMPEERWK